MGNGHEHPCFQPCICFLSRVPAVGAHVMALPPYSSSRRVRNKQGSSAGAGANGGTTRVSAGRTGAGEG